MCPACPCVQFTVWDCGSTVGQRLLGLEYFAGRGTVKRASRAQILALVSLGTLLPWLRERCLGVGLGRLPYHRRCQVSQQFILPTGGSCRCSVWGALAFCSPGADLPRGYRCQLAHGSRESSFACTLIKSISKDNKMELVSI